ncbi:MAG: Lrp/AsnC family transcriptional regulator [candidate division Zixibacteria bacterium]|nr:Lrp/AsnC family transcriptional regulator [candidate division Zixibacteria bacterium]
MIDKIDRQILTILQENSKTSNSDIADRIGMAASATLERVRKLEKKGIIKGYEIRLDAAKLNCGLVAFVFVKTSEMAGDASAGPELIKIPEVQEVFNVAGEDCYLIKVRTSDTSALGKLIRDKIGKIPAVVSTRTTIVMETYKETSKLPLEIMPGTNGDRDD